MTTPIKNSRTTTQARDTQLIAGIQKRLQGFPPMTLGGVSYTPATLVDLFQGQINAINSVSSLKAQWHDTIQTEKAVRLHMTLVIQGIKALVLQNFPGNTEALADFGFTAKKRAVQTAEQKAAAAQKRAATRVARNTMGPKAKLAVKGVVATPPPAHPAPAAGGNPPAVAAPAAAPAVTPAPAPGVTSGSDSSAGTGSNAGSGAHGA